MMNLVRYREQTLGDMRHLILEPLMRDRIAIATTTVPGKDESLVGIAIWASVSDEADALIRGQVKAGVFPIRLKSEDWSSGETLWLLDVIAPSRELGTAVLANFREIAKDKPVHIHPVVARGVDQAALEKMKMKSPKEVVRT